MKNLLLTLGVFSCLFMFLVTGCKTITPVINKSEYKDVSILLYNKKTDISENFVLKIPADMVDFTQDHFEKWTINIVAEQIRCLVAYLPEYRNSKDRYTYSYIFWFDLVAFEVFALSAHIEESEKIRAWVYNENGDPIESSLENLIEVMESRIREKQYGV